MKDRVLVSVIVPVYNVESYLLKCLDSLVSQSFNNFEIIAVNDGSTDNCPAIINEYQSKYNNVKVVNKENGGLSSARNAGIKAAVGQYVCFVDADDYVEEDFVSQLYNCAVENNSDAVVCAYKRVDELTGKERLINIKMDVPYNKSYDSDYKIFDLSPYAWNKLFKRSLIINSDIEFPMGKVYEDIPTIYPWLSLVERISVVDKPLYNYRINRGGSIMSGSLAKSHDMLDSLINLNDYFKAKGINAVGEDKLCSLNVRHIMYRLTEFKGCSNKKLKNSFIEAAFELLNNSYPNWKKCSYFDKYNKSFVKRLKKILMTKKLFWKLY